MTNKFLLAGSVLVLSAAGTADGPLASGYDRPPAVATPAAQTQTIVAAATAFLKALDPAQRDKVQFPFPTQQTATLARFERTGGPGGRGNGDSAGGRGGPPGGRGGAARGGPPDSAGRGGPPGGGRGRGGDAGRGGGGGFPGFIGEQFGHSVWSNYPVSDVPRPGLQLGSLTTVQRAAAMQLLQAVLSARGYQKVIDIMGADQALKDGGTNYAAGNDVYTLGIFGTPSTTSPWMVQFGGHHLGLNVMIVGARGVITPTMTGAQPALYTRNGVTIRPMGAENDKAFVLLNALTEAQRKQAILNYAIGDLLMGPGHSGETIVPEGLKASTLTDAQRTMLLDVIAEWAGIVTDRFAAPRIADIKAGLADTYFAWSGPTTHEPGRNGAAYYRIQGPKLLIEFSPQGVGGDLTMHVHTVYRDPTNEYGQALIAKQ